jgi:sugar phosphate isomerase/epimerase
MTIQNARPVLLASQWMHSGPFAMIDGRAISPWTLRARVEQLGRTGFTGIGLYHDDLSHILGTEAEGPTCGQKLEWVRRLLVELEFLTAWSYPEGDPRREAELPTRELLFEAANVLEARHVKAGLIDGAMYDRDLLNDSFALLCDEMAGAGCRVGFELVGIDPNSADPMRLLDWACIHSNGGLHLDTVAGLPSGSIVSVELDDGLVFDESDLRCFADMGPAGFFVRTGMRRIPGEGDYDLAGFVRAVRASGFDGPWGCEVISEDYKLLPMSVAYRRVHRAMCSALKCGV